MKKSTKTRNPFTNLTSPMVNGLVQNFRNTVICSRNLLKRWTNPPFRNETKITMRKCDIPRLSKINGVALFPFERNNEFCLPKVKGFYNPKSAEIEAAQIERGTQCAVNSRMRSLFQAIKMLYVIRD